MDSIEIRACQGLDELEACVRLQIETWGVDPSDTIPRRSFLVAQKIGGQVLGAFERTGNREEGGWNEEPRAERLLERRKSWLDSHFLCRE
jgi:predicted GNAT superfamily acetyltransferase